MSGTHLARAMKLFGLILTFLFLLTMTVPAYAETFLNQRFWFDDTFFVPCANGGTGEQVHLRGYLHVILGLTFDSDGGFHWNGHVQPENVSGDGLTTGDAYIGTGPTQDVFNGFGHVGEEAYFIDDVHIIAQGGGANFHYQHIFHFTLNADGTITGFVSSYRVVCR